MWFKKKKKEKRYLIKIYMTPPLVHYLKNIPTKEKARELLEKIKKSKGTVEFPDWFIKTDEIIAVEIFFY